jgi:hypothetical protein
MSHEPTDREWACATEGGTIRECLTLANAIRDRRIRNAALEEAARMLAADYAYEAAAEVVRALKTPEPKP